jgi:hypothetical protein
METTSTKRKEKTQKLRYVRDGLRDGLRDVVREMACPPMKPCDSIAADNNK